MCACVSINLNYKAGGGPDVAVVCRVPPEDMAPHGFPALEVALMV